MSKKKGRRDSDRPAVNSLRAAAVVPGWRCSLAKSDGPLRSLHGRFCWDRGLACNFSQSEAAVKALRRQGIKSVAHSLVGEEVGSGHLRGGKGALLKRLEH